MKSARAYVFSLVFFGLLAALTLTSGPQASAVKKLPLPSLDPKLRAELRGYLEKNHKTPEDYVLSKFKDHQIVFIGEYHRIQHDSGLIRKLVPLLHKAGVYNLGIEFGIRRDQDRVDKLINAPIYDEQAAREIMFDFASYWGYKDYMDIYRAAWEVNHQLPPGARRFRVVNLNAFSDWSFIKTDADRKNREIMKKVWPEGDGDQVMAEVIMREFGDKGQKALVYSGIHHAFTRYRQPIYYQGKFVRFVEDRMGNRVFNQLGDKVFTIYLHAPWSDKTYEKEIYAAGGAIDAFFARESRLYPVGFDLAGTPFGELTGPGSIYEEGYDPFTLKLYADGYIFTKPISQYHGVSIDEKFVTEANFKRAVEQIANPEYRSRVTGPKMFMEGTKSDADMGRRFAQFY